MDLEQATCSTAVAYDAVRRVHEQLEMVRAETDNYCGGLFSGNGVPGLSGRLCPTMVRDIYQQVCCKRLPDLDHRCYFHGYVHLFY